MCTFITIILLKLIFSVYVNFIIQERFLIMTIMITLIMIDGRRRSKKSERNEPAVKLTAATQVTWIRDHQSLIHINRHLIMQRQFIRQGEYPQSASKQPCQKDWTSDLQENKLAKARKMRKPPGKLSLKKFGLGNLWVKKVWNPKYLHYTFGKYTFRKYTFGKHTFKKYTSCKYTFGKYTFGKYTFGKCTKIIGVLSLQLFT